MTSFNYGMKYIQIILYPKESPSKQGKKEILMKKKKILRSKNKVFQKSKMKMKRKMMNMMKMIILKLKNNLATVT